jgi:hypothetical protein
MVAPYIQVAGKSNILIGFPDDDYATVDRLGEQMDETRISVRHVLHDVPGDSQGGPAGDPIEQQILALQYTVQFNLSKWAPDVRDRLIQHNAMATLGSFADSEIGALLLRDRSFRIVISPSRDSVIPAGAPGAGEDYFYYNFCCCTVTSPIETGQGTKFSALQFSMRAWRVPEGHPLAPGSSGADFAEGLIWNRDTTGVPSLLLPPGMR